MSSWCDLDAFWGADSHDVDEQLEFAVGILRFITFLVHLGKFFYIFIHIVDTGVTGKSFAVRSHDL